MAQPEAKVARAGMFATGKRLVPQDKLDVLAASCFLGGGFGQGTRAGYGSTGVQHTLP